MNAFNEIVNAFDEEWSLWKSLPSLRRGLRPWIYDFRTTRNLHKSLNLSFLSMINHLDIRSQFMNRGLKDHMKDLKISIEVFGNVFTFSAHGMVNVFVTVRPHKVFRNVLSSVLNKVTS